MEYIIPFLVIITLNFFIPRFMPGDPFTFLSSDTTSVSFTFSEEEIEKYKEYYGLDEPLGIQYKNYIGNLVKGYLGYSIFYNDEVIDIIKGRLTWTIILVLLSTLISAVLGTALGSISAYHRQNPLDQGLYFIFVIVSQIPSFLIGIIILFIFGAHLKWFPLSGGMTPFTQYSSYWAKLCDLIYHAMLPAFTLSFVNMGSFYLLARNSMIEVLSKDYIMTAKAKALKKRRIILRHALQNAILPVITRIFLSFGSFIGGAVLVENVFHYPGLGSLMRDAVFFRDYPVIQGIFLIMALSVLSMNLLADVIYKKIDSRLS
jgi:peptide/nickel transport system permease protein